MKKLKFEHRKQLCRRDDSGQILTMKALITLEQNGDSIQFVEVYESKNRIPADELVEVKEECYE